MYPFCYNLFWKSSLKYYYRVEIVFLLLKEMLAYGKCKMRLMTINEYISNDINMIMQNVVAREVYHFQLTKVYNNF